jgi:hypothetical protein
MFRWLLGSLLLAAATMTPRSGTDAEPDWLPDLARARAAARAAGKPIFLVFRCER